MPHWSPPSPAGPQQASASLGLRQGAPASLRPRGGLRGATAAAAASPLPAPTVSPPPPPSFPPLLRPATALQGAALQHALPRAPGSRLPGGAQRGAHALRQRRGGALLLPVAHPAAGQRAARPHHRQGGWSAKGVVEAWRGTATLGHTQPAGGFAWPWLAASCRPRSRSPAAATHAQAAPHHITCSAPRPARPASCWPSTSCRSSRGPAGWSAAPAPAASPC